MSTVQPPPAVLETVATTEVTQLVLTERESRDLGHWQTMRSCFHPDIGGECRGSVVQSRTLPVSCRTP